MASNTSLRDSAVAALKATTISYPQWVKTIYKDRSVTNWAKALALLTQITDDVPQSPQPTQMQALIPILTEAGTTVSYQMITKRSAPSFLMKTGESNGSTYDLFIDDQSIGRWVSSGINVNIQVPVALSDGLHVIWGTEVWPNAGSVVTPVTFLVDTTPPVAPSAPVLAYFLDTGTKGDNITSSQSLAFNGTGGTPGCSVFVFNAATNGLLGGGSVQQDGSWYVAIGQLPYGTYSFYAKQSDEAQNLSDASPTTTVVVTPTAP